MCQKMCSTKIKHPLSRARKSQAFLSVISWPCALAAVFTTRGSPEAWVQLIAISIASITPVFMLTRYRRSGSKSYAALEIAIDALLTLLLLGIYVAGIIILASRGVSNWSDIYDYKIARGIPQVYANLSCILICLLYFRSFTKGFYHRYIKGRLMSRRGVSYVLCPSCDRSVDAQVAQSQDMTAAASVSTDNLQGLYTDDVESQPLLRDASISVEGKQTTGVVNNN